MNADASIYLLNLALQGANSWNDDANRLVDHRLLAAQLRLAQANFELFSILHSYSTDLRPLLQVSSG